MRKHSDFPIPVGRTTIWFLTMPLCSCSMILEMTRIWYGLSAETENLDAAVRTMVSRMFSILTYTFFLLFLLRFLEKIFQFFCSYCCQMCYTQIARYTKTEKSGFRCLSGYGAGKGTQVQRLKFLFLSHFPLPDQIPSYIPEGFLLSLLREHCDKLL